MTQLTDNRLAIFWLAKECFAIGATKTFGEVLVWLNANEYRNALGQPYTSPRGVARLISATYAYVKHELGLGDDGAQPILDVFTDRNGEPAF